MFYNKRKHTILAKIIVHLTNALKIGTWIYHQKVLGSKYRDRNKQEVVEWKTHWKVYSLDVSSNFLVSHIFFKLVKFPSKMKSFRGLNQSFD